MIDSIECVCGYKHESIVSIHHEDQKTSITNKPFREILVSSSNGHYDTTIYFYACPKCGTLKVQLQTDEHIKDEKKQSTIEIPPRSEWKLNNQMPLVNNNSNETRSRGGG